MKYIPILILILASALLTIPAAAEEASTFGEAKTLSANTGKPILLEFVRED
jgi:ABC-type Fe3+ transport system permease subunit